MGVTLSSKNLSVDMGYGGFKRFREKVAFLASHQFGEHYATLDECSLFLNETLRIVFLEKFNQKTAKLIEAGVVSLEVVDFCLQSDCEGKVKRKQASVIYESIKDYNDNIAYGYAGRSDCATFESIKEVFADSVENGGKIRWS